MIGEIKGITFLSILYLIFGLIGSFIINKLEKDIFKENIESKSDTRVIYEMVITFILMISFLYYLHKYLDTIRIPFHIGNLDKESVMFSCEIIAATLFTYTSKLNEKVNRFFETKTVKTIKNIKVV